MADLDAVDVDEPSSAGGETDTAGLSDDAILDQFSKSESPSKAAVEEPEAPVGRAAPVETTPVAEVKESGREEPLPDERSDPQELRRVFKAHPQLRAEHYTLAAYKDVFPDIKVAREIRDLYPTMEDAKEARETAAMALNLDATFRTNQAEFIRMLAGADTASFKAMASKIPEAVYSVDRDLYNKAFVEPVINEFPKQFAAWAQSRGDDELVQALEIVQARLNGLIPAPATPSDDPRLARLGELERMERERTEAAADGFFNNVGESVKDTVAREVWEMVERSGSALSQGAKQEVLNRVVGKVGEVLSSDSYLQHRIQYLSRSGRQDQNARDMTVSLMMAKARAVLRKQTSETLGWMTRDILSLNDQKRSAPQGRREVGGGSPSGNNQSRPNVKQTSRMSADEIMEAFSK